MIPIHWSGASGLAASPWLIAGRGRRLVDGIIALFASAWESFGSLEQEQCDSLLSIWKLQTPR